MILLRKIRESYDLTQAELAQKSGLTQAAISQFEDGKRFPSTRSLSKISKALQVPMETLLAEETSRGEDPVKDAAIKYLLGIVGRFSVDRIVSLSAFLEGL